MRAMLSSKTGGPETLILTEKPTPEPQAGEVRIAIRAAGINFPDTIIIRDLYQIKPERPFAPGGEISGVIEALGEGVGNLAVGDRVLALTVFGGFSTHICIAADRVIKIPDQMPFDEAACFLFTYGTSHYAYQDCAFIKSGETVLILGASGGIGVSAIELAKAAGATVIAAVSSQEKAAFCQEIGADHALIYGREMDRDAQRALGGAIKDLTKPNGVDIVYDAVGGDYAEPALRSLGWNGRFLVIGFAAGIPKIPLNLPLLKNCSINGVFWGAFTQRSPERFMEHIRELFELYGAGKIRPRISARYPLEDAAKALSTIEDRTAKGKIVLTID